MPPTQPWILITPGSRGIGYALTKRILQTTKAPVVITARSQVGPLTKKLLEEVDRPDVEKRLQVMKLDFLVDETIQACARKCQALFPANEWHLHLAMVLPGYLNPETSITQLKVRKSDLTFHTHVTGPLMVMNRFSKFLPKKHRGLYTDEGKDTYKGLPQQAAVWANMSARVGSISDNKLGGWYTYRASKAAVNQITKTFDLELEQTSARRAMAVALHPGTVKTDLSRNYWDHVAPEKLFEPDFAAERLMEVINGLDVEEGRGRCWDWKGDEVPP